MSSIFKRKNKKSRDSVSNGNSPSTASSGTASSPVAASSSPTIGGLGGLSAAATNVSSQVSQGAQNLSAKSQSGFQGAQSGVQSGLQSAQQGAQTGLQNVQSGAQSHAKSFQGGFQNASNQAQQGYNSASAQAQQGFQNVSGQAQQGFQNVSNQTQQGFQNLPGQAQQGFQNASNQGQQGFQNVSNQTQQGYNSASNQAQQGFQNASGHVQKGINALGGHGHNGASPGPGPNGIPPSGHHVPGAPSGSSPTTPSMQHEFNSPASGHGRSPFPQMTPQGQGSRSPKNFSPAKFGGPEPSSPTAAGFARSPGTPAASSAHPWTKVPITNASPFPRYGHASNYVAARDGEIFVMGGLKGADVFGDLWVIETEKDSMAGFLLETEGCPSPRVGHAALTLGNAFIVFGGDTKVTDTDTPDDNLYLLNTSTLKWTVANPKGSRPAGRYGHSLSTVGSKLFVFGGQLDDYFFDDLVCFDLTKLRSPECRWTTIEPADGVTPPPRTNHTVVTYQDKLYMYGGTDGQLWYSDTWCFDPVTNIWTQLNCSGFIPTPSEGHAATVVNDIMYVFGGRSSKGDDLGVLSALKLSAKRWFTFENMGQAPAPRSGHSMTAFSNHKVLVMGGESHDQDDTHVYVLDTSRIKYPQKDRESSQTGAQDTSVQSISSMNSTGPRAVSPAPGQSPAPGPHQGHGQISGQHPHSSSGGAINPPAPGAIPLPGMVPTQDNPQRELHQASQASLEPTSPGMDRSLGSIDRVDRSIGSIDDEKYDRSLHGYMQPGQVENIPPPSGHSSQYDTSTPEPGYHGDDAGSSVPSSPTNTGFSGVGAAAGAVAGAVGAVGAAGIAAVTGGSAATSPLNHRSSNLGSTSDQFESADDMGRPDSTEEPFSPSSKIPAAWPTSSEDEAQQDYTEGATPREEHDYSGQQTTNFDDSDYSQSTTPQHSVAQSPISYANREPERSDEHHTGAGAAGAAGAGVAGVAAGVAAMGLHQKSQEPQVDRSIKQEPRDFDHNDTTVGESDIHPVSADAHSNSTHEGNLTADTSEGDVQDVIEQLKATNSWYESELTVAKQSGFTPSKNPVVDIEKVRRRSLRYSRDQGASLSERDILVQALVEVKQELQNVKADVARQSEEASQQLKAANDENQQLRAELEGAGSGSGSRDLAAGGVGAAGGVLAGGAAGAALSGGDSELASKHAELQKKYNLLVGGSRDAPEGVSGAGSASVGQLEQQLKQEQNRNASLEHELETLKDELADTQTKWKDVGGVANEHVTALQAAGAALAASQSQHTLLKREIDGHKSARVSADEEVTQLKRQLEDTERRLAQTEEELETEREAGSHAREQSEHSTKAMTGGIDKILAIWGGSAVLGGAAGYAGSSLANSGADGSRELDAEGAEVPAGNRQFAALQKQVDGANKLHLMHREAAEKATADLGVMQSQVAELKDTLLKSEQQNHELINELEELKGHVSESRRQLEDHEQTRSVSQTQALRLKELEAELTTTLSSHKTELESLEVTHRNKMAEMEKAKKDSLTYMQNSDLALRKTREELTRTKEQVTQLQDEMSELQIRGKGAARGPSHDYDDDDDDDEDKLGSHQLELQLRDTRATLVVVEQERDELRLSNADLRKKAITNVQDVEKYKRRYQRLKSRGGEDSFNDSEFDHTANSGFEHSPRQ